MVSTNSLPSTVIEYASQSHRRAPTTTIEDTAQTSYISSKLSEIPGIVSDAKEAIVRHVQVGNSADDVTSENPEFKLPGFRSLFVIIGGNCIFQASFFVVVSSASAYAEHLGGSEVFSGLTIGIPTLISAFVLIVITRYDQGKYSMPLHISYASMFLGNVLYALAYRAHFLYLILIGRLVSGVGFIAFMYSKRYCSDPRIVGIRRRTTLGSWLVVGQGFGFTAGPFIGGLLFKIGFKNEVFNGVTSPGWLMAVVWILFWALAALLFEDVGPKRSQSIQLAPDQNEPSSPTQTPSQSDIHLSEGSHPSFRSLTSQQWGVIVCMCWYAMTCFLILGCWEANIPIFTAHALNYSPFRAGNFIALGGLTSIPFLLLNVRYARLIQDRVILAVGTTLGLLGLLITLIILKTDTVTFGSLLVCWSLIALGFNLASTCTLSLLSKQLPDAWNRRISLVIQCSNYSGRVTGAVLGGAGVKIGMLNYVGIQIAIVGIGGVMYLTLWKSLKAKTG